MTLAILTAFGIVAEEKPVSPPAKRQAKVGVFRDRDGVLMITNRVDKYARSPEYTKIDIKYERVVVPKAYRTYDSPAKYSGANIQNLVSQYAAQYRLDPNLVYAVIDVESNFNPNAKSPKGACGLMQLMPATAEEMGVTRIFDPAQNIAGGVQYLAKLMGLFNNDLRKTLAAYNAGPGAVLKYKGVPPYEETQEYVREVIARMGGLSRQPISSTYLTKVYNAPTASLPASAPKPFYRRAPKTPAKKFYTLHFFSGLTQPAESVTDAGAYYSIRYGNGEYLVPKEHVSKIDEPA